MLLGALLLRANEKHVENDEDQKQWEQLHKKCRTTSATSCSAQDNKLHRKPHNLKKAPNAGAALNNRARLSPAPTGRNVKASKPRLLLGNQRHIGALPLASARSLAVGT
jgi:hypothetical protein